MTTAGNRYNLRSRTKSTAPKTRPTEGDIPSPRDAPQPPKRKSKQIATTGTSRRTFPPFDTQDFGIIQTLVYREPFWLIIAVTLLNQTPGRSAGPIFWRLKERYPHPSALAAADFEDVRCIIQTLGLQTQRSHRIIKIAQAWAEHPPKQGVVYRTKDYPLKGDGRDLLAATPIKTDQADCSGALEIGHIPGTGPYAWDSWRIFCRDMLRGVADDYNGLNAVEGFEPEWKRVLPLDKELRACLQWMWLREGWQWDIHTGNRSCTGSLDQVSKDSE